MTDLQDNIQIESEAKQQQEKGKKKKTVDLKKEIISWILTLAAAVAIALVIRTFIFEPVRVDGNSMLNTLRDGEIMFVTKPEYLFGDPMHGDVVICRYPNRKPYFVKRVVGIPGDTVGITGNVVYINGEAIDETYLADERNRYDHTMQPITLGENEYFVMGDHRDDSNDSRSSSVGPLMRNQIIGHVRYVLYPFNRIHAVK